MTQDKTNDPTATPIDTQQVQSQAASTLLDEGVIDFSIKGIGKFSLTAMKLGTMLKISKICNFGKNEHTDVLSIIGDSKNTIDPVCKIVSYGILNSQIKIFFFSRILANRLKWKLDAKELHRLLEAILSISEAYDFFVITVLLQGLSVTKSKAVEKESR